jgi:hypothetical protein
MGFFAWVSLLLLACALRGAHAFGPTPEASPFNCTQTLNHQTTAIRFVLSSLRRVAVKPVEQNITDCASEVYFALFDFTADPLGDDEFLELEVSLRASGDACEATIPDGHWGLLRIGVNFANFMGILEMQFALEHADANGVLSFADPCPPDGPRNISRLTSPGECLTSASCSYDAAGRLGPELPFNETHRARSFDVADEYCIQPESARIFTALPTVAPTPMPTRVPTGPTAPTKRPTAARPSSADPENNSLLWVIVHVCALYMLL